MRALKTEFIKPQTKILKKPIEDRNSNKSNNNIESKNRVGVENLPPLPKKCYH